MSAELRFQKALLLLDRGQGGRAEEILVGLAGLGTGGGSSVAVRAMVVLGDYLVECGRGEEARRWLERALAVPRCPGSGDPDGTQAGTEAPDGTGPPRAADAPIRPGAAERFGTPGAADAPDATDVAASVDEERRRAAELLVRLDRWRGPVLKLNQVVTWNRSTLLGGANLVGVTVAREHAPRRGRLDEEAAVAVMEAGGRPASVAVSFERADGFTDDEMAGVLERLGADYYEFTPVDPAKKQAFAHDLGRLARLSLPKIANGFFLEPDDVSLFDDTDALRRLTEAGVVLFQVEIAPDALTSASVRARLGALFAEFPVVVCLPPEVGLPAGLPSPRGYSLTLRPSDRDTTPYDYCNNVVPGSTAARVLRARARDREAPRSG
ncbi:hypothetical protein ACIBCM_28385 [Streptomyces sp. NPDC051018]|uniref:hypothetical protein n=1 Tax=Streptomyces sp. NPDC051018 TaxID=3365639 RepID=UPI0037A21EEC